MAGEADLERFALRWGLPMVAVDDLRLALSPDPGAAARPARR
jgi:hypothetical protein